MFGVVELIADLHFACLGNGAPAFEPVDFVFLEEELDAAGVLADGVVFIGEHLLPVDGGAFALEAHGGEVVLGFVQHVGGVQEGLGRNAADVEAGAAQCVAAFDHSCFEAKLGAADG